MNPVSIYKRNNTRVKKTSQENNNDFLLPSAELIQNDKKELSQFSQLELAIFNYILFHHNNHTKIFILQQTIADAFECSREYVNRTIKKFETLRLIKRIYRHMRSCIFLISFYFKSPEVRNRLSGLLSALKERPSVFVVFLTISLPHITRTKGIDIYNNHLYEEKGTRMSKILCDYPSMNKKIEKEDVSPPNYQERIQQTLLKQQIAEKHQELFVVRKRIELENKRASIPVKENGFLKRFPYPYQKGEI
jgi:hypothetical protein